MTQTFTTPDGGILKYQVIGEGDALCFIHGSTLDSTIWNDQLQYFSKKYKVVTYDLRGFGQSSLPTHQYSHHQDLHDLLRFLNIDTVNLIGLSLGGEIAIDFTLEFPTFVNKLILVNSSLSGFKSTVDWQVHAKQVGVPEAKKNWLEHQLFGYSIKNLPTKRKLKEVIKNYSGWHWVHTDSRQKAQPLAVDRLEEIQIPTLIMVGQYDLSYFQTIAEILAKQIVNAKKVFIPRSGHLVNLDNPQLFNRKLEQFLQKTR